MNTIYLQDLLLSSLSKAHDNIAKGNDKEWWNAGTSTLIVGCLVEV